MSGSCHFQSAAFVQIRLSIVRFQAIVHVKTGWIESRDPSIIRASKRTSSTFRVDFPAATCAELQTRERVIHGANHRSLLQIHTNIGRTTPFAAWRTTPRALQLQCSQIYGGVTVQQTELKELFIDELKDIFSAETQLVKALPKMAKAAKSADLRSGFEKHLKQTEGHVSRLESIFEGYNEKPTGKKCKGMEGLIEEGDEAAKEDYEDDAKDAALIGAAQRVEHYEMAAYGTVRAMAEKLGDSKAVKLLTQTLQEEKDTDEKLTELAEKIPVEGASKSTSAGH